MGLLFPPLGSLLPDPNTPWDWHTHRSVREVLLVNVGMDSSPMECLGETLGKLSECLRLVAVRLVAQEHGIPIPQLFRLGHRTDVL